MRIITGDYRGRKLETPAGREIRPTTDKVKESIFNILMNDIEDAVCVDLFAGTGNLGLEALSRGAKRCYFCDISRDSISLIKRNIEKCDATDRSIVFSGDYAKTLTKVKEKINIFFLDPPYRQGLYEHCLEMIDSLDLLADDGIIITEHGVRDEMPEKIGSLIRIREKKYGTIMVSLYAHVLEEEL
ncbi:16S rRNA (guanine966-N2)-methyltransferase [Clostridiales Family XIII bacterium PM5-7]